MSKSAYLRNKILDHVLGGGDYTRPATVYFALFSADPGTLGTSNELSYTDYARAAMTNNATNFPAASSGVKLNGTTVTFPMHGGGASQNATHFGIFDASTSGNFLAGGSLDATYSIDELDQPIFEAGSFSWTET